MVLVNECDLVVVVNIDTMLERQDMQPNSGLPGLDL
jgi:hypothetical protein